MVKKKKSKKIAKSVLICNFLTFEASHHAMNLTFFDTFHLTPSFNLIPIQTLYNGENKKKEYL